MSLKERITQYFSDAIQIQQESLSSLPELIEFASHLMANALINDKKIISCGNGGSSGNALHFSALMLNKFQRERPSLPAITLNSDTLTLTSIANDYHFDEIFAKQLRALGQEGDILLCYSTSGNSANILKTVTVAQEKNIPVIALTGQTGGSLANFLNESDLEIRVPASTPSHIQEMHLLITHCLCDLIDQQLFGG
jgi:D-sedoheptulose 7-phosphate isomerase